MSAYWKATRPDGRDFRTGTIDYAGALATGEPVMHPAPNLHGTASSYLSVATVPTDCTGFSWPCRLFRVEPVGEHVADDVYQNKVRVTGLRVVEERPAHEVFGPNGPAVVAVIERAGRLTREEVESLHAAWNAALDAALDAARYAALDAARYAARYAAWYAAWDAAWNAALDAARYAARYAAWYAAWDAARYAALAELARDLITLKQYETLIGPWWYVIGGAS